MSIEIALVLRLFVLMMVALSSAETFETATLFLPDIIFYASTQGATPSLSTFTGTATVSDLVTSYTISCNGLRFCVRDGDGPWLFTWQEATSSTTFDLLTRGHQTCGATDTDPGYSGTVLCTRSGTISTDSSSYTMIFTDLDTDLATALGATGVTSNAVVTQSFGAEPAATSTLSAASTTAPALGAEPTIATPTSTTSNSLPQVSSSTTSNSLPQVSSSTSTTAASPTGPTSLTPSHRGLGLSRKNRVGIGVGVGVGVVLAFLGLGAYLLYRRRSSRAGRSVPREEETKGFREEVTKGTK